MKNGFLYALINGAIPNYIKLGFSAKKPSECAQELADVAISGPTTIIYETYINDCERAKEFIYALLNKNGHQLSGNEKYINVPIPEVISAIMLLPSHLIGEAIAAKGATEDELCYLDEEEGLNEETPAWVNLWEKAESYHFGFEDNQKDIRSATQYYQEAAELGCNLAYYRLAEIVGDDFSSQRKHDGFIQLSMEGTRKGNYLCHLQLAIYFAAEGHQNDAKKHTSEFFNDRSKFYSSEIEFVSDFGFLLVDAQHIHGLFNKTSHFEMLMLKQMRETMLFAINWNIDYHSKNDNNQNAITKYLSLKDWVIINLYDENTKETNTNEHKNTNSIHKTIENSAAAVQLELGLIHEKNQHYTQAYNCYLKAAEQGSAEAEFKLGVMHEHNYFVQQSYNKAIHWYRKAADQNHAKALLKMANFFENGKGVCADYTVATDWYFKAAKQGYSEAQYWLGSMFKNDGDYAEAINWFTKAVKQNHGMAQYSLDELHRKKLCTS